MESHETDDAVKAASEFANSYLNGRLNRRQFAKGLLGLGIGVSAASAILAACGGEMNFILGSLSALIWLSLAIVLGVATGLKNGGRLDNTVSVVTYVLNSFPTFILGFALIWI